MDNNYNSIRLVVEVVVVVVVVVVDVVVVAHCHYCQHCHQRIYNFYYYVMLNCKAVSILALQGPLRYIMCTIGSMPSQS